MKKAVSILFFILLINSLFAQVVFNTSYHNFGEINASDKKYFDFTLTNVGKVTTTLLRIEEAYGIDAKFSKKEILPDSTIIVRIKYTPKKKGKFKKDVPVWLSVNNEPLVFTVEGNAKTFDVNESLACPDFSTKRKPEDLRNDLTVNVVDATTKKPIKNATVEVIWDGIVYKQLTTDKKGKAIQKLKWSMYYFVANAEGYATGEQAFYVNGKNNTLELQLTKLTPEEKQLQETEEVIVQKEEEVIIPPKDTVSTTQLPVNLYAPNNVVFLIDVSVSMKQQGRLDLLKASMIELLNGLRSIDRLAIVTYASSTDVILASEYVTDKAKIIKLIQGLKAGGYTAGGKGIKKAYQVARENKIEGGNNQVIIATDGAFNLDKGSQNILNNVEANFKKGVSISVVGVKNEKWTVKSMSIIASTGGGHYLHIESFAQAKSVLMNEIKSNSKKQ